MNFDKSKPILVVDDDGAVAALVQAMLQHAGYSALTASSAIEALRICESSKPYLVISDIEMPGMNGYALTERLRGIADAPPVLLMSGYARHIDPASAREQRILAKPFTSQQLLEALSHVLRDHAGATG